MANQRFHISAIFKAYDKFSGPVAKMTTRMGRFQRKMSRGFGRITRMAKRMVGGFRSMALGITVALVSIGFAFKGLFGPATDFEKAMAGVNAVTLGTIKNFQAMRDEARRLGRSTIFTASEVAGAMEIMARAGLNESQVLGGVQPILHAAAAEGAAIEETARVIISTMKGFDLSFATKSSTRVADVFAFVSSKAKTNILALGEGLSKVAPVAKEFNLKFEDMIALVATLQDVGIEASMSGTQLKTMLTKLSTLTPKAAKGFKKIGFEAATAGKNMKQAPKLLAHLYTALLKTGGNMEKVATIADAVGLRGAVAASVLATAWGKGERGIQGLLAGIANEADGAAAKMNFLRQNQLAGDITRAKSAWNDFRIELGKTQMPKLRGLVQSLTAALKDPEIIQKWVTRLEAVVENLETIFRQNIDVVESTGGLAVTIGKVFGRLGGAAWNLIAHTRWIIGTVAKLFTWVLEQLMDWMDSLNATGAGRFINSSMADINETDPSRPQPQLMSRASSQSNGGQIMSGGVNGTITIENNSGNAVGALSESEGMSFDVVGGRAGDFN